MKNETNQTKQTRRMTLRRQAMFLNMEAQTILNLLAIADIQPCTSIAEFTDRVYSYFEGSCEGLGIEMNRGIGDVVIELKRLAGFFEEMADVQKKGTDNE